MNTFKTIARFRDLPLAELAESKLNFEGVYCFLTSRYHVGINWLHSMALGGIRLQVPTEHAEEARRILNEDQSEELWGLETDFPPLEHTDFCINCGSTDLEPIQIARKAGAISLLIGFPLPFFQKRYQCRNCGCVMKTANSDKAFVAGDSQYKQRDREGS